MKHIIGVDGGGSKTLALVMSEAGHILGWARGPGSNHENIGFPDAESVLAEVSRKALASAGMDRPADLAFWALAGADVASDFVSLRAIVDRIAAAEINIVENDIRAVMGSGLTRDWGVGIVCGAGFNACGISPEGSVLQFPSLGELTGDWGGGTVIGMEVLRLAHRSYDGREIDSLLRESVPSALGLVSFEELPTHVRTNSLDYSAIRDKLPPLLFQSALLGDRLASGLVTRIGSEVGITARTVIERLKMDSLDVEIVLGGSILNAATPQLIEAVEKQLFERVPGAILIRPEFPPVVGAAFQALRALGVKMTSEMRRNARATLIAELKVNREAQTEEGKGAG